MPTFTYMNTFPKDITTLDDIKTLVDTFYGKVRNDELLKDIFNNVIQDRWPIHLEKMYGFWQTILLGEHNYSGSPFPPHAKLPIGKEHFDRWIKLFTETMEENFEGPKATEALTRAQIIADTFHYKIEHLKGES